MRLVEHQSTMTIHQMRPPNRIEQCREHHHPEISRRWLADYLGVTTNTIRRWENGEVRPPIDQLVRIADLLRVPVDHLLGRDSLAVAPGDDPA